MNYPEPGRIDVDRVLGQRSLRDFVEMAWSILEPDVEFRSNFHIDAMCDHLEAVTRGEIKLLWMNLPPSCGKSLVMSAFWPAWEWITNPRLRYLCVSYEQRLSTRNNRWCRDIVMSQWYQDRWPHVQLAHDQNQKEQYQTTEGGWRIGTTPGGRGTGEHPDRKIFDDPHNVKQAESDVQRMQAIDFYDGTMSSRGLTRGAATVGGMQRVHERDLSGHVLAKGGPVVHLNVPMRYEPQRMETTPLGWNDPRTTPGELMWPDLITDAMVSALERDMGSYRAAGQLQQRPAPMAGGLLKRDWWKYYKHTPALNTIVLSWDTALKAKTNSDYTVGQAWGQGAGSDRYLLRLKRGQWELPDMIREAKELHEWAMATYPGARVTTLVENAAAGPEVIAKLRRQITGVVAINVDKDKVLRVQAASPAVEGGNCWLPGVALPDGTCDTGLTPAWVQDFVAECASFPNAAHDDRVDAFTQAMQRFDRPSPEYVVPVHANKTRTRRRPLTTSRSTIRQELAERYT